MKVDISVPFYTVENLREQRQAHMISRLHVYHTFEYIRPTESWVKTSHWYFHWLAGRVFIQNILCWVDKKNQLDVTFCILYFSSNSCSTCFGQPCAHHQELTTTWCYSIVLVCAVTSRSRQLLMMGTWLPEACWATIRREIKNTKSDI